MMLNKKAQYTDIFIFMIISLVLLFVSGIFIYLGVTVKNELNEAVIGIEVGDTVNYTEVVDSTLGDLNSAYSTLYWLSILIIVGMIISIFIGSYMVTTRPIFFVPYIFIVIIATIVAVGISNAYQLVLSEATELASTFQGFLGANFIMFYLPVWVVVISFVGGIIMFARMKSQEVQTPFG